MDLPTYTNIWRIEKRLYKLYDFRLPMPLPVGTFGVALGVFALWVILLGILNAPFVFGNGWHLVLWVVPPGVITVLVTRPVIEGKRLTELLLSQARFLAEARVYTRLTPEYEPAEIRVAVRVWHRDPASGPLPSPRRRFEREIAVPETVRAEAAEVVEVVEEHRPAPEQAPPLRRVAAQTPPAPQKAAPPEPARPGPVRAHAAEHSEPVRVIEEHPEPVRVVAEHPEPARETAPEPERSSVATVTAVERSVEEDTGGDEETPEGATGDGRPGVGVRMLNYFGFALDRTPAEPARPHADDFEEGFAEPVYDTVGEAERDSDEWFSRLRASSGQTPVGLTSKSAYADSDTSAFSREEITEAIAREADESTAARRLRGRTQGIRVTRELEERRAEDPGPAEERAPARPRRTGRPHAAPWDLEETAEESGPGYDVSDYAQRYAAATGRPAAKPTSAPWLPQDSEDAEDDPVRAAEGSLDPGPESRTAVPDAPKSVTAPEERTAAPTDSDDDVPVPRTPTSPAASRPGPVTAPEAPASVPARTPNERGSRTDTPAPKPGPAGARTSEVRSAPVADARPASPGRTPEDGDDSTAPVGAKTGPVKDPEARASAPARTPEKDLPAVEDAPERISGAAEDGADAPEGIRASEGEAAQTKPPLELDHGTGEHEAMPAQPSDDEDHGPEWNEHMTVLDRHLSTADTPAPPRPTFADVVPTGERDVKDSPEWFDDGKKRHPDQPRVGDRDNPVIPAEELRESAVAEERPLAKPPTQLDHGTGELAGFAEVREGPEHRRTAAELEQAEAAALARRRSARPAPEEAPTEEPSSAKWSMRAAGGAAPIVHDTGSEPSTAPGYDPHDGVFHRVAQNARRIGRLFGQPAPGEEPEPPRREPRSDLELDHGTGEQESLGDTPAGVPALRIEEPAPEPAADSGGTRGWRRLAKVVTGGAAPVRSELSSEDIERLRTPLDRPRGLVVLGCTGGAGQTVTTLMIGHTLAEYRDERIVAVDVNPGPNGLSRRIGAQAPETLTALLANADAIGDQERMSAYTSRTQTGLEVVQTLDDPYVQTLDDRDYAQLTELLGGFYAVTVLDPAATGVARALPAADGLVLVAPANADAERAVSMTFDWLDGNGHGALRANSVLVVNGVSKRSLPDVDAAERVARGRCRAIVRIPWDDHLGSSYTRIDVGALRANTKRAHGALAGVIVDKLLT
ncbi:TcpE family conjugal transfer membrane protein [Nocardiopsis sp. N85]|uniref:TcpE family conjugal transfer membrane protein n=1 Tax=Nocardiopsis sp. N85 TaxID=3029400 RepID=UPI00237EFE64|nr:TcpE family conjugal transfer membrane protein [Nocardiopsis sp. N85]MDE3721700.1 TcpE family conjugal transfer membrane protein [Nocardiopsis sp. N85]